MNGDNPDPDLTQRVIDRQPDKFLELSNHHDSQPYTLDALLTLRPGHVDKTLERRPA